MYRQGDTFRSHDATTHFANERADKSIHQLQDMGSTADPIERLRLLCLTRGPTGILALGRMFRRMDYDGNTQLTHEEFVKGLREVGLEMTHEEANEIFEKFNGNRRDSINMGDFLEHIRPAMHESRKKVIDDAFTKMDTTGDGVISISELKHLYNVKSSTRYISGEDSEEMILRKFMANFEDGASKDGMITYEEFVNYYSALSASVDNDCFFDLMMRQAYKL